MLIRKLPNLQLDIVGDIHGELDALNSLLFHLGYDHHGIHQNNRHLVFVGDLCDRGPDSVGVIKKVKSLVESGHASCLLGNHELNLINEDPKDGSGWFFTQRLEKDKQHYSSFTTANSNDKEEILAFLHSLPLILEREDVRVVHAAWYEESVARLRVDRGSVTSIYADAESETVQKIKALGLDEQAQREACQYDLEVLRENQPMLHSLARRDALKQMGNPIRVLTSGIEKITNSPFYSSHKYRFTERVAWWNEYTDDVAVIFGHYWRAFKEFPPAKKGKGGFDLFAGKRPSQWLGPRKNVFCVDFSVGARYLERREQPEKAVDPTESSFRLGAIRWPERELVLDCGATMTEPDED